MFKNSAQTKNLPSVPGCFAAEPIHRSPDNDIKKNLLGPLPRMGSPGREPQMMNFLRGQKGGNRKVNGSSSDDEIDFDKIRLHFNKAPDGSSLVSRRIEKVDGPDPRQPAANSAQGSSANVASGMNDGVSSNPARANDVEIEPHISLSKLPSNVASEVPGLAVGEFAKGSPGKKAQEIKNAKIIRALWNVLCQNTKDRIAKGGWIFKGEMSPGHPAVDGRFDNIKLVEHSAIENPVDSVIGPKRFLHANEINLGGGLSFIASQQPVASEIPGFHQMLLDKKVGLIIDLTKGNERDDEARYAPANGKSLRADGSNLEVSCAGSEWIGGPNLRLKHLKLHDGVHECEVQRLHFKAWPDHGTISADRLIALADQVDAYTKDHPDRPVLIHCRAGVGRTGSLMSFIAARNLIREHLEQNPGKCSPQLIVSKLMEVIAKGRIDRGPQFVQNDKQFAGVLETLLISFKGELNGVMPTTEPTRLSGSKRPRVLEQSPEPIAKRVSSDSTIGLWARLARKINIGPSELNVSANEVGSNKDDVVCVRRSAIGVRMIMADLANRVYLHANKIVFSRGGVQAGAAAASGTPSRSIAEAGQSPQEFRLCERFLVQGLDSERGLFQFVSPEANQFPHLCAEKTIIDQLHQRWNDSGLSKNTLILGGRYVVTDFKECNTEGNDYRRIQLSAVDLANPGKVKTIYLTQAGLQFDDNKLRSREIARADALMESHKGATGSEAQDPMVISYLGIGRNAALICYREAVQNLGPVRNEEELDALLEKIVADGRRDRGPGFIHSEAQLEELRSAVLERYRSSSGAAHTAIGATSVVERDLTSINE